MSWPPPADVPRAQEKGVDRPTHNTYSAHDCAGELRLNVLAVYRIYRMYVSYDTHSASVEEEAPSSSPPEDEDGRANVVMYSSCAFLEQEVRRKGWGVWREEWGRVM